MRLPLSRSVLLRSREDVQDRYAGALTSPSEQLGHMEFLEFNEAFAQLTVGQREAPMLIRVRGFSYAEAAEICGCPSGTLKSRVNRACARLAELMSAQESDGLGSDQVHLAVLLPPSHSHRH